MRAVCAKPATMSDVFLLRYFLIILEWCARVCVVVYLLNFGACLQIEFWLCLVFDCKSSVRSNVQPVSKLIEFCRLNCEIRKNNYPSLVSTDSVLIEVPNFSGKYGSK